MSTSMNKNTINKLLTNVEY